MSDTGSELTTAAISAWRDGERGVVEDDLKKIEKLADGVSVPLWKAAYGAATALMQTHQLSAPDLHRFKSAVMSVQSSIGNSCERLLAHYASQGIESHVADEPLGQLVDYLRDDDFAAAIRTARGLYRSDELDEDALEAIAERFFVDDDYVLSLVSKPKANIRFPDSVSVFADPAGPRLVIAEHKLTGDNDEKAVLKNLDALAGLRNHFVQRADVVQTAVALPFTLADRRLARKWENKKQSPDQVAVNAEVWELLAGISLSEQAYQDLLGAAAKMAGDRIFQWVAHPQLVLDTSTDAWQWVQASDVTAPVGGAIEDAQQTLDLLSS